MKQIIYFNSQDTWNDVLDVLQILGYKWMTNISATRLSVLYERGVFLRIDGNNKLIAYYGNYYKLPKFYAEELMDKSIDGTKFLEQIKMD